MPKQKIKTLLEQDPQANVTAKGWIKSVRDQKSFLFIELNDGSSLRGLQVIADASIPHYEELKDKLTTGSAVSIRGELVESPGKNQKVELRAEEIELFGTCDVETYPLQKKRHSFEFLRTIAHLRVRTNTQGAVLRIRSALSFATHLFFQKRGFLYIHTPIISTSDCEGGAQMFEISTLDSENRPFFGKPAYLTVSGQLEAESAALGLGDVYTFGPTFRAENSNTSRHLAEFWMIEPEMAFADLEDNIECAESYLKFCIEYVFKHNLSDLEFFDQFIEKGLLDRLKKTLESPFERLSYKEAITHLEKSSKTFSFPVAWGVDLQSEHERYLTEELFKKPLILTDYPAKIKSFYMRENPDQKTVSAMDILVPKVGEIIGGSQREERLDVLERKIQEFGLKKEDYWWYLELRKFGSAPHAGFGLGLERLVLFVTGMENIRDVSLFPRYPGHAEF